MHRGCARSNAGEGWSPSFVMGCQVSRFGSGRKRGRAITTSRDGGAVDFLTQAGRRAATVGGAYRAVDGSCVVGSEGGSEGGWGANGQTGVYGEGAPGRTRVRPGGGGSWARCDSTRRRRAPMTRTRIPVYKVPTEGTLGWGRRRLSALPVAGQR